MGILFSASTNAHLLFISNWGQTSQFITFLREGRQSPTQRACYLPSLSRYPFIHLSQEEQIRVKCLAQGHNLQAHTGFKLASLGLWVRSFMAELCVLRLFFIHLSQEEQIRVKCLAQEHNSTRRPTQGSNSILGIISLNLYGWAMHSFCHLFCLF